MAPRNSFLQQFTSQDNNPIRRDILTPLWENPFPSLEYPVLGQNLGRGFDPSKYSLLRDVPTLQERLAERYRLDFGNESSDSPLTAGSENAPSTPSGGSSWDWSKDPFQLGKSVLDLSKGAAQLYLGFAGHNLARRGFNHSRSMDEKNMDNSILNYNTNLEDRIRGRGYTSQAQIDAALSRGRLSPRKRG